MMTLRHTGICSLCKTALRAGRCSSPLSPPLLQLGRKVRCWRSFNPKLMFYPFFFLNFIPYIGWRLIKVTKHPCARRRNQLLTGGRRSEQAGGTPCPASHCASAQRRAPRPVGRWLYPAPQWECLRAASAALLLLGWRPWL